MRKCLFASNTHTCTLFPTKKLFLHGFVTLLVMLMKYTHTHTHELFQMKINFFLQRFLFVWFSNGILYEFVCPTPILLCPEIQSTVFERTVAKPTNNFARNANIVWKWNFLKTERKGESEKIGKRNERSRGAKEDKEKEKSKRQRNIRPISTGISTLQRRLHTYILHLCAHNVFVYSKLWCTITPCYVVSYECPKWRAKNWLYGANGNGNEIFFFCIEWKCTLKLS